MREGERRRGCFRMYGRGIRQIWELGEADEKGEYVGGEKKFSESRSGERLEEILNVEEVERLSDDCGCISDVLSESLEEVCDDWNSLRANVEVLFFRDGLIREWRCAAPALIISEFT